jgi:uncharacterized protein (DUF849 family)
VFDQFVPRIAAETGAIINITTGGSTRMTIEERLAYAVKAKPELCSLNMGSMNFAFHKVARGIPDWKYPWERAYVEGSENLVFKNTFADIKEIFTRLGEPLGTRFEFECYDVGHLYNLAHMVDRGLVHKPMYVQLITGTLGGIGPGPENLMFMKQTAEKLFGDDFRWSVLAGGRHQLNMTTMAATMGGNVRVGLEDSLYAGRGRLATSNAEQVRMIRNIIEGLTLDVATPDEARQMLGLKGKENVKF